jgi:hypothetical protein
MDRVAKKKREVEPGRWGRRGKEGEGSEGREREREGEHGGGRRERGTRGSAEPSQMERWRLGGGGEEARSERAH